MNDNELREAFRTLADNDARSAPAFSHARIAAMRPAARARRMRRWVTASGVAFAAAAVLMFVVIPRMTMLDLDVPDTRWATSTDFLLKTPGSSLLNTLPAIGVSTTVTRSSSPAPRGDTSGRNK